MAKSSALSLCLLILTFISVCTLALAGGQKTWCVAKPSTDDAALQANLDFVCGNTDCGILQPGCACFSPDNRISHASVAMNLYYQRNGRNQWNCFFNNSALITQTDPSFGSCVYE